METPLINLNLILKSVENINNIKNNIILIGMMGSWKSTVGKKLSKNLGMEFLDTDHIICDIINLPIKVHIIL